jgi:hypothetical protein
MQFLQAVDFVLILLDRDDGVFVASYKASSVTESVDLVARLNAISSRTEDRLSLSVN